MENGKYYLGELKNDLPNGKGIKYYSNGNILYEGDFINDKFEGKGKYIYDDGDYKNGLRNGKGIIYYKNGNIMSEGGYINDKKGGMENIFGKIVHIILENGKMVQFMEKGLSIIQMEKLDMMVNIL